MSSLALLKGDACYKEMSDCRAKSSTLHHPTISLLPCQGPGWVGWREGNVPFLLLPSLQLTHPSSFALFPLASLTDLQSCSVILALETPKRPAALHCFGTLHPMPAPSAPPPPPKKFTSFSHCFIVVLPNTFSLCKHKCIFFSNAPNERPVLISPLWYSQTI